MSKYEVRFESESGKHCVVEFRVNNSQFACGDIVYSSYDVDACQDVRNSLELDQDPAYQKYLQKQEAYAFEDCF